LLIVLLKRKEVGVDVKHTTQGITQSFGNDGVWIDC
jgi:hypothetical protein